ncbi:phospholipase D-like domain-containing protein [Ilumatobacter sp.]|uniref:phospholipase D-like domain-containing protein n=1 Tax=Ilumatobacter sp. TaxID=1967498 RepID=UPI003AF6DF4E
MTADDITDVSDAAVESDEALHASAEGPAVESISPMSRVAARLLLGGCALAVVGVFTRWTSGDGVTLNGIQGPHNGWIVIVYLVVGVAVARAVGRGSRTAALTAVLVAVVVIVTVLTTSSVPGFGTAWGYWLTFLGGVVVVVAAGTAFAARAEQSVHDRADDADADADAVDEPGVVRARRLRWPTLGEVGLVVGVFFFLLLRQVLAIGEDRSWPPPTDAITAAEAEAATADFVAEGLGPHDVGLDYAWSTAASVEPWAEGATFYPKIFDDVAGADSSIHILMFGWKPGDVGDDLTSLLVDRLADGVEVRILVDGVGSQPTGASKAMYERLVDAGAVVVVNDTLPFDRDGPLFDRGISGNQREVGRADHRKLYVIDGEVAWTGGAGIEDHFLNGEFYDVMVRVTGDVVRQTQAVFLTSFAAHDVSLPADLSRYFPEPTDPGRMSAAVGQVVPGGFVSATQAARELIDSASQRLDIMNPYLADRDMIERMIMAAERGVDVRVITSEESNNAPAAWAMKHRYGDLLDAGVEIWEYPGAVVHAKLIVADDRVQFGTLNLDAWALYRNFEIALMVDDADVADRLVERAIDPAIGRAETGLRQGGLARVRNWFSDKLTYFL